MNDHSPYNHPPYVCLHVCLGERERVSVSACLCLRVTSLSFDWKIEIQASIASTGWSVLLIAYNPSLARFFFSHTAGEDSIRACVIEPETTNQSRGVFTSFVSNCFLFPLCQLLYSSGILTRLYIPF